MRGLTNWSLNDLTQADSDFSRAAELDSENALVYIDRGEVRAMKYEFEDAIKDFDTAERMISQLKGRLDRNIGDAQLDIRSIPGVENLTGQRRADKSLYTGELLRIRRRAYLVPELVLRLQSSWD